MKSELLSKKLGELQADIYWFHDARLFDKLASTAADIFELLDVDKVSSERVGKLISDAYQFADKAEEARIKGRLDVEKNEYMVAEKRLSEAGEILGYKKTISRYQILWWMFFRHKKTAKVIYYMFMQHLQPYGVSRIFKASLLTYYLVNVGLGHNRRDKNFSIKFGKKYWNIIIKKDKSNCPFIG